MATEDIKENAMSDGKPTRLRGLDANGNSISPTIVEVENTILKNYITIILQPGESSSEISMSYSIYSLMESSSIGISVVVFSVYNITPQFVGIGSNHLVTSEQDGKICVIRTGGSTIKFINKTSRLIGITLKKISSI